MTFFAGPTVNVNEEASSVSTKRPSQIPVPPLLSTSSSQSKPSRPTTSVTSWIKNMLPSNRPERGGTVRRRGYWEDAETSDLMNRKSRRRFEDSHLTIYAASDASDGPDCLVRWNTAKDVSQTDPEAFPLPKGALSTGHQSHSPDIRQRQWPWLARESRRSLRNEQGQSETNELPNPQAEGCSTTGFEENDSDAAAVAERRLSRAQRLIEARRKIRHERRDLKESGDYLGVQGINPRTGELDSITPTDSEGSSASLERERKLQVLREKLRQAREASSLLASEATREVQDILHDLKVGKGGLETQDSNGRLKKAVKWRAHTKQWSSVQEPVLSPIAQSRRSTIPSSPKLPESGSSSKEEASPLHLICLASPANRQAVEARRVVSFADVAPRQTSASTPGSHGTVIQTPCRQNMTRAPSAALELFENGINFDTEHNIDDGAINMSKPVGRTRRTTGPGKWEVSAPDSENFHEHVAESEKNMGRLFSPVSFSGIGLGQDMQTSDPYNKAGDGKQLEPSQRNPRQHAEQPELVGSPKAVDAESQVCKGRLMKIFGKATTGSRNTNSLSQELGMDSNTRKTAVGSWMPVQSRGSTTLPRLIQRRTTRTLVQEGRLPPSLVGLSPYPIPSSDRSSQSTPSQVDEIETPLAEAGSRLPEMMRLDMPKGVVRVSSGSDAADQEWIDSAVQEITKCGSLRPDSPAYIPIITTTGSDLRVLRSREMTAPRRSQEREIVSPEDWMSKRSATTSSAVDAETWKPPAKAILYPPRSSASEISVKAGDVTTEQQTPPRKNNTLEADVAVTSELSTPTPRHNAARSQHTFISTFPKTTIRRADSLRSEPANGVRTGTVENYTTILRAEQQARASLTDVPRIVRRAGKSELESPQIPMPGRYPDDAGDDDVIADLFKSTFDEIEGSSVLMVLFGLFRLLYTVVYQFARAYWVTVQPMINAKSEFWNRHARHNHTWTDGVRTILAAPGVIATITVLV